MVVVDRAEKPEVDEVSRKGEPGHQGDLPQPSDIYSTQYAHASTSCTTD